MRTNLSDHFILLPPGEISEPIYLRIEQPSIQYKEAGSQWDPNTRQAMKSKITNSLADGLFHFFRINIVFLHVISRTILTN